MLVSLIALIIIISVAVALAVVFEHPLQLQQEKIAGVLQGEGYQMKVKQLEVHLYLHFQEALVCPEALKKAPSQY